MISFGRSITHIPSSWGQHGAHLGPVGPRWSPCWPHKPCCHGRIVNNNAGPRLFGISHRMVPFPSIPSAMYLYLDIHICCDRFLLPFTMRGFHFVLSELQWIPNVFVYIHSTVIIVMIWLMYKEIVKLPARIFRSLNFVMYIGCQLDEPYGFHGNHQPDATML